MHIFRLLAARRRAVSTITAAAAAATPAAASDAGRDSEDEGPFFDLDLSVRASSSSGSQSGSDDSDDECTELDFIISLHRSRSASPSYESLFFGAATPPALKFCTSELSRKVNFQPSRQFCAKRGGDRRTLSFGAKKAGFYGGRHSFARSSFSARSLRLFMESPADDGEEEVPEPRRAPSRDVIRRYLTKISRRFRRTAPRAAGEAIGGLRRLRKSRSASAATTLAATSSAPPPSRRDDSLLEKQDGIASAIAHCKESLHRASVSDCDSSLSRSRSDPGKREPDP